MFDELKKYKKHDHFFFNPDDNLAEVCNVPKNICGVYIIYALTGGKVKLFYIGSSGKIGKNGEIRIRDGGLFDRIVNGKQFEKPRRISWPQKMKEQNIDALDIYWYETFSAKMQDLPAYTEAILFQRFFEITGRLSDWNEEF